MANTVLPSTSTSGMVSEPLWLQTTGADPAIPYAAQDDRALIDSIFSVQGVLGVAALKVTQRGAGANFSVDIAVGQAVITGDDVARQGKYVVQTTAVVNCVTPAAPGSGTRIHRVIARIRDKQALGSGTYDWSLELLEDTGTGTPAEPNSAITLALVSIATAQASVTNANITDSRALAQLYNSGGIIGQTTLAASAASVVFSALPAVTSLQVLWNARGDNAATNVNVNARLNGDTGSNYFPEVVQASAASLGSFDSGAAVTAGQIGLAPAATATAGYFGSGVAHIPHSNAAQFQAVFAEGLCPTSAGAGGTALGIYGFHWRSASAVTSVTLLPSAGNFIAGSQFTLIGYN